MRHCNTPFIPPTKVGAQAVSSPPQYPLHPLSQTHPHTPKGFAPALGGGVHPQSSERCGTICGFRLARTDLVPTTPIIWVGRGGWGYAFALCQSPTIRCKGTSQTCLLSRHKWRCRPNAADYFWPSSRTLEPLPLPLGPLRQDGPEQQRHRSAGRSLLSSWLACRRTSPSKSFRNEAHHPHRNQVALEPRSSLTAPTLGAGQKTRPSHRLNIVRTSCFKRACSFLSSRTDADMKASTKAIRFLESLSIPEGPKAGQSVKLAPFQKQFVKGALADGINVACLSIGRGNAKTALSAGISLGAVKGVLTCIDVRYIYATTDQR